MGKISSGRLMSAGILDMLLDGTIASMLGTLVPDLSIKYHLSPKQNGEIAALQALGLMIASIAAGPLIDNKGKKTGFLVGLSLIIVSLIGLPHSTGRGMIAACMFFLGLGGGTVVTGANTLVSDVGAEKRASMLNLAHLFFGVGGLLTPFVAANMLGGNPIRLSYLVALLAALAFAFQAAIAMPPPTHEGRFQIDAALKLPGKWILVLLSLFAFLYVACEVGFWNWLPKYLIGRGIAENRALNILGFGFALGMLTGRLVGSRLLLKVSADMVCLVGSLLIAGTTFWTLRAHDPTLIWVCVFLTGFVMGPVFPSAMGLTGDAFPLMTATCMGIVITAGWTGTVVSSWLIGTMTGTDNSHLGAALLLLPAFSVVMFLIILVLRPMLARARRQVLVS
jgi:fucose permease